MMLPLRHWSEDIGVIVNLVVKQICVFLYNIVQIPYMEKKMYKNRIRVVLADRMVTNTYLAEQLGVSKMTISRWCTNTTQPSAPQLIEISKVLKCELKDLYEPYE